MNEGVNVQPQDVIDFWFDEVAPERRFAKDDALDRAIAARFGTTRDLTLAAIERGWENGYPSEQRLFLYMPLMHAEDAALQALSVEKFEALGDENALAFARDHQRVQARYGRFPSRNASLGRASSPEEQMYLAQPDAGW